MSMSQLSEPPLKSESPQSQPSQGTLARQGEFGGSDDPGTNINTTLLVPAFLISGILLIGIIAVLLWKRTSYRRVIAALEASQPTANGVERPETVGDRAYTDRTALRDKPRMWEVWIDQPKELAENGKDLWGNILPISAQILQNSSPQSSAPISNSNSSKINHFSSTSSRQCNDPFLNMGSHVQVSVMIAMPSHRLHLYEKEDNAGSFRGFRERNKNVQYPFEIMLGLTDVACHGSLNNG